MTYSSNSAGLRLATVAVKGDETRVSAGLIGFSSAEKTILTRVTNGVKIRPGNTELAESEAQT
jgi:hypothetical protein